MTMLMTQDELWARLKDGPIFRFADWPIAHVPALAAGVYTIWNSGGAFLYAGMSGRSMKAGEIPQKKAFGLFTRLASQQPAVGAEISSASMWPTASSSRS